MILIFLMIAAPLFAQEEAEINDSATNEADEFPQISFGGLLDARFVRTDETGSWLDGELGKTRYGSEDSGNSELLRLSQASLLISAAASDVLSARLQINVDADPDELDVRNGRIDLIEAFGSYRPVLSSSFRLRLRGGIFFPPVSLENRGPAWTTPYSITTSAINSWIGEEVRVAGAEFGAVCSSGGTEVSLSVAAFGYNDPAGTLLAWRGWALHDRQTGWNDHLPLAGIPALQPDGLFPRQPHYVEPFREVDGRVGFYGSGAVRNRYFELNGIYYDNRGEQTNFDGLQYAWKTDFGGAGIAVPVAENFEVLGQYMAGAGKMGFRSAVNIDFDSFYVLATARFDSHRISARYDDFSVDDQNADLAADDNREDGNAWTLAYIFTVLEKHRLAFEVLRVKSARPSRTSMNLSPRQEEWLFQTSFRFQF